MRSLNIIEKFHNKYKENTMNQNNEANYSKYHYYGQTDFDRLIEENINSKGFIVIGKENAVLALKNYENIPTLEIIEQNGSFEYVCDFNNTVKNFIMRKIQKHEIQDAIKYIKNHKPKQQKIKKEVLVFE